MKHWTELAGITEASAELAEYSLVHMMKAVEKLADHPDIARIVFDEAMFRVRELPRRTPEYVTRYLGAQRTRGG